MHRLEAKMSDSFGESVHNAPHTSGPDTIVSHRQK